MFVHQKFNLDVLYHNVGITLIVLDAKSRDMRCR